jgi:hypothetical protein
VTVRVMMAEPLRCVMKRRFAADARLQVSCQPALRRLDRASPWQNGGEPLHARHKRVRDRGALERDTVAVRFEVLMRSPSGEDLRKES